MRTRAASALLLTFLLLPATAVAQAPTTDHEAAGQVVPPTVTSAARNQFGFAFPEAPTTPGLA